MAHIEHLRNILKASRDRREKFNHVLEMVKLIRRSSWNSMSQALHDTNLQCSRGS